MKAIAHFLSLLFHPIFVPSYATTFVLWNNPYITNDPRLLLIIVVINTLIFPMLAVGLMKALGIVSSVSDPDRNDRLLLYLPALLCFIWASTVMMKGGAVSVVTLPTVVADIILGATLALAFAFASTAVYYKISAHAMGMGGLVAVILYAANFSLHDVTWWLMGAIGLAGLIGTCRLVLGVHTHRQVYYGYLIGFLCTAGAFIYA